MDETIVSTEVYIPKQQDKSAGCQFNVMARLHNSGWSAIEDQLRDDGRWTALPGKRIRITVTVVEGGR